MKNIVMKMSGIVFLAIFVTGCNYHCSCLLNHYVNPVPRQAMSFTSDTLSIAQLTTIYQDLMEGDTITIRGRIGRRNDNRDLDWGVQAHDYYVYLYDEDCERNRSEYSIQFLRFKELWFVSSSMLDEIPTGTQVVLTGILHFEIYGPGATDTGCDGFCEEFSFMKVLDYVVES